MAKTSKVEIVKAARDLMREKGFAGASMKDLAARVGLLKGSLYSHFSSKEELVPRVLELTSDELLGALELSGNWRADYEAALNGLVTMLVRSQRCVGLHLAYGLNPENDVLVGAVRRFFADILGHFERCLAQELDTDLARDMAKRTVTMIEGATLWLVLDGDLAPLEEAKNVLKREADSHAYQVEDDKVKQLLKNMMGDWRLASTTERQLAAQLIAMEGKLHTLSAALAGQVEAGSCFL